MKNKKNYLIINVFIFPSKIKCIYFILPNNKNCKAEMNKIIFYIFFIFGPLRFLLVWPQVVKQQENKIVKF
jgi:hypothetical protein